MWEQFGGSFLREKLLVCSFIIIPFRKSGNQIEYYDNKWILNNNEHIETIVLENIVNTYLEEIKNDDGETFSNTSSEIKKLKHTNRLAKFGIIRQVLKVWCPGTKSPLVSRGTKGIFLARTWRPRRATRPRHTVCKLTTRGYA